ncbi:uncharacterized protein C6orf47 homolog isoform X1 [Osmerus mordax]|uniref:uncharacterized protein C6orf47 homolog isoform X1 n=2 Tax=Osmerus mordax TaxID=8014 RepID=UPI00350FA1AE
MAAVVGRVWSWVRPAITNRPWSSSAVSDMRDEHVIEEKQHIRGRWGLGTLTAWVWGRSSKLNDQTIVNEEYIEAEEKLQPMEMRDLCAEKQKTETKAEHAPRWWNKILPSSNLFWPRESGTSRLRQRKCIGWSNADWDLDHDEEFSDYGTPPPSPTPPSFRQSLYFRLFAQSWMGEIVPEHFEICFNFIRHLFDLFVVGFLWTVSPPAKFILEVLGVQGALKLWLHGMALFFVSTVGMAGLLLLIQEFLPQFALVYGIVQALVISVSVRQSVILGEDDPLKEDMEEKLDEEELKDNDEHTELHLTTKEGLCLTQPCLYVADNSRQFHVPS